MIPLLPDVDALVLSALRPDLPSATVRVSWPTEWAAALPLVVAKRVPGGTTNQQGIDMALVDVQCAASDRSTASELARTARVALARACRAQFKGTDGYLTGFRDVSGPVEIDAGSPDNGPDLFRFQATYRVTARPINT